MLKNKQDIIDVLTHDGVIAYVTDTVWGLGCLPESLKAVKKIYEIKNREAQKPLILMSNDIVNLLAYVDIIPKIGQKLIKQYFPGARFFKPYNEPCKRAFTAPALAHNSYALSAFPFQRNIIECLEQISVCVIISPGDIFYRNCFHSAFSLLLRSAAFTKAFVHGCCGALKSSPVS